MKTFHGYRHALTGAVSVRVCVGETSRPLDAPDEGSMDWKQFSGAGRLAVALITDAAGPDLATPPVGLHVMRNLVVGLAGDGWTLTEQQVQAAVDAALKAAK